MHNFYMSAQLLALPYTGKSRLQFCSQWTLDHGLATVCRSCSFACFRDPGMLGNKALVAVAVTDSVSDIRPQATSLIESPWTL